MTTYKLLFSSSKYRFAIFLRPEAARQQKSRLLGTAAALDIPINNATKGKRISKLERKAMVEDYVNKYRSMNGGKFPAFSNVRKQVGGTYYTVKNIVQELQHNSNLSDSATAGYSSSIRQTAQVNEASNADVITGCQVSNNNIAVEEYGISAESDLSCEKVLSRNIFHKKVDVSNTNKNHQNPADYLLSSDRKSVLEFAGERDETSACKEMCDDSIIIKSQQVENMPLNQTSTTNGSELTAKTDHPSVVTGTSKKSDSAEADQTSIKAFESDELARGPTLQKSEDKKPQEASLWGNLKGFANNIISFWRKT